MDVLASLFVGKPANIGAVFAVFLIAYLAMRFTAMGADRNLRGLLYATIAWGLYAGWEWLVQARTPEADIRVDLLVIWPVLGILSLWGLYRLFR